MSDPIERKHPPNSASEPSGSSRRRPSQLRHAAIKHGGYSGMSTLPGENRAEFNKLHKALVRELAPNGPLEHDIVETIARLKWRKECLWTYGLAEFARQRYFAIKSEQEKSSIDRMTDSTKVQREIQTNSEERPNEDYTELLIKLWHSPEGRRHRESQRLQEEDIRRRLGPTNYELANLQNVATTRYLIHELSIIDRIDGMIDRCLKRLLLVRGVKSIQSSLSPAPKRIAASGSTASGDKR